MTPKKPEWFEMTEGDTPATGLRKVNKTLPISALLVAGALLFGGSFFTQGKSADSNVIGKVVSTTAPVKTTTDSNPSVQSAVAVQAKRVEISASSAKSIGVPTIAPVVGVSSGDDDDNHRNSRGHEKNDDDEEGDDD